MSEHIKNPKRCYDALKANFDVKDPELEEIREHVLGDQLIGVCLACFDTKYGCEPDACKYPCDSCKALQVYGVAEIFMSCSEMFDEEDA